MTKCYICNTENCKSEICIEVSRQTDERIVKQRIEFKGKDMGRNKCKGCSTIIEPRKQLCNDCRVLREKTRKKKHTDANKKDRLCKTCNKILPKGIHSAIRYCLDNNTCSPRKERQRKIGELKKEKLVVVIPEHDFVVLDYLDDFIEEARKELQSRSTSSNVLASEVNSLSWRKLHSFIERLKKDSETIPYARMLDLELEYIRREEKNKLIKTIERKLGNPIVAGRYTLEDIGTTFGVTRERVRQIEMDTIGKYNNAAGKNLGGKLNNPRVSRSLRTYTEQ